MEIRCVLLNSHFNIMKNKKLFKEKILRKKEKILFCNFQQAQ